MFLCRPVLDPLGLIDMTGGTKDRKLISWGSRSRKGLTHGAVLWLFMLLLAIPASAQSPNDLTSKTLEELMDVKVTTASRKEEKLFQTAAAIYVITQEDIRRSGMTRIPDLLRLVPGLDVARIDGVGWAVGARGFNGRFANKLLVLIDGRSVYSRDSSGVYWELVDMPLDLIDRIEIIRGPGGTLWGANAVNGVINIITRPARETQGGLLTVVGGSEDRGGSIRYGGTIGDNAQYRTYAKYLNGSGLVDASGKDTHDGQNLVNGGFRVDWQPSKRDSVTLHGDMYNSSVQEAWTGVSLLTPFALPINAPAKYNGENLVARWDHAFSASSDMSLQFYYDHFHSVGGGRVDTVDFDFQHHFELGSRQDIVWGLGYRLLNDEFNNSDPNANTVFSPESRSSQIFSGFFQDQITLVKDRLRLTVGAKLEHDDYAHFNIQPNVRLLWTPTQRQTVWAAVSRAVRTPSRGEEDVSYNVAAFPGPSGLPIVLTVIGSSQFRSEDLRAYEFGYRRELGSRLSVDIASFYNVYHRLQTDVLGSPFFSADPVPRIVLPIFLGNQSHGSTYGAETSVSFAATPFWKLTGSYSFLRMSLKNENENVIGANVGDQPQHQFQLRSYVNLPGRFELDVAAFYVSSLPAQAVPAYTRVDARLGWRVSESVELSFGAQNLLDRRHLESRAEDASVIPTQVKRTIFAKLTWRF
jgi:iron complex outermembrane receptor protein